MKNLIVSLMFVTLAGFAFADIGEEVSAALKVGNSKELAKYFASNVELTIISKEGNYSKAQAEQILKDFFASHPVKDFQVMHQGGENGSSRYTIGTLTTSKAAYRVFYLVKTEGKKQVVSQLRIENQEE